MASVDEGTICPKSPDGPEAPHSPDWNTITVDFDGGEAYIDVSCQFCGRSGCLGTDSLRERITW